MTAAAARQEVAKPKKGRAKRPGKKREAQAPLPQGDTGPETPAQMHNADIVPMHKGNWYFKRRLHPLDRMARPYGKRRDADITARERNAGIEVVNLHEATERSGGPAWNKVYVDSSPKPGDIDVKRLEAETKLRRMWAEVPREARPIVNHVIVHRGMIRREFTNDPQRQEYWLGQLRSVLKTWAKILGY